MTDEAKKKALGKHQGTVTCPGCGKEIKKTDDMSNIEYVRTKRTTDVFFHTECLNKVWHRNG